MPAAVILYSIMIISAAPGAGSAREPQKNPVRFTTERSPENYAGKLLEIAGVTMAPAAVDTFHIAMFDFEPTDWQGWSSVDETAQKGTFFQVDDFAGLGGGDFGRLVPIEGTKSAWCGARQADNFYMCGWGSAPGYGNGWDQSLGTVRFSVVGQVTISCHVRYDTEPDFDLLSIEYSSGALSPWTELESFDGTGETVVTSTYLPPIAATKLRFHFVSDGAWSDEDGLHNTDGAAIIDSITVSDSRGVIDFEDFESATAGDRTAGIWQAFDGEGFGSYASLGHALQDKDPCNANTGAMIVFWNSYCPPSVEYPGLYVTPFCNTTPDGQEICQKEYVVSPPIDMTRYSTGLDENQDAAIAPADLEDLGGTLLDFTVYADLPYANLVYYDWMVREIVDGCPGQWQDRGFGYGGANSDYLFSRNRIDDLVDADTIQVAFRAIDLCAIWFDVYGDCAEHTTSPYFDNVEILRYKTNGPQWYYRAFDLFQDNFPSASDIESYVRADAANDINSNSNPLIRPGDSIVVNCDSPLGGGIAEDAGGARVYMHVKCTYLCWDELKPAQLAGPALEGTYGRYVSDDGTWTIIQGDTAMTPAGNPVSGRYMFDLNDSLFTRGYMIEYYFKAYDNEGETTTLPENAETVPDYPYNNGSYLFEFTCLPTLDVISLYVDDCDGTGSNEGIEQIYVDATMDAWGAEYTMDRYDVSAPASMAGNGLVSRAKLEHLLEAYSGIFWDSGDLSQGTIGGGIGYGDDKNDDCQFLIDFLDNNTSVNTGLLVAGDNVASEVSTYGSAASQELLGDWCGISVVGASYFDLTGGMEEGIVNPLLTGLNHCAGLSFYLDGGCPGINDFDVLEKTAPAQYFFAYPDYGGQSRYAGIGNSLTNSVANDVRTAWLGFSFMNIRNGNPGVPARNLLAYRVIREWLQFVGSREDITGADIPVATALGRSYPNPFNPATMISFDLAAKGQVSIRIYNVAGQLVRTLVDGERGAGRYSETWDGKNDAGSSLGSGVYFLKMKAGSFESSRKLVLLR
jgi:hypothetical protein